MDDKTKRRILELHREGFGRKRIADELGLTEWTVRYWLQKLIATERARNELPESDEYPKVLRHVETIDTGGEEWLRFAVVADTHIGSKEAKLRELLDFLDRARRWGAEFYLHAGDLIDGTGMYTGQEYEQTHHGLKEQIDLFLQVWGEWAKPVYFILGNHDTSFWKRTGTDVGEVISMLDDRFIYLGAIQGMMMINGIKIMLWHGSGAGAYALSYKLQKFIESFIPGGKPRLLFAGHWHQAAHIFYRNIDAFQSGCFQGMTKYIMAKGLQPAIGGWLVELWIKKGEIKAVGTYFVPYYVKTRVRIDNKPEAEAVDQDSIEKDME